MPPALLLLLQHRRSGSVVPSYRGGTPLSVSFIPCFSSFISVSILRASLPAHRLVLPRKVIASLRNAKVIHSVFDEKSSSRFASLQLNFLRTKPCLIPFPPWRHFVGQRKTKNNEPYVKPINFNYNEITIRRTQHHSKSREPTPRTGLHCPRTRRCHR